MSVQTSPPQSHSVAEPRRARPERDRDGWLVFIGVLFTLLGVLNVIYGIAAIGESRFFIRDSEYVFSDLRTWGWITLFLGVAQVAAAVSIARGGAFGRVFGIAAAGLSAIGALLAMPGYPFWSLAVFAVDILVIYGLTVYGGRRTAV